MMKQFSTPLLPHVLRRHWSLALLGLLLGCGGDTVAPSQPVTDAGVAHLYWALTLDQQAITLSTVAPYDTLPLIATPRDGHGAPLTGLGPVTFTSSDPERIEVTPSGVLRALKSGQSIEVTAELVVGNVRHVASTLVNVTDDSAPPVLAHLSIQAPDSTTWPVSGDGTFFSVGAGTTSNLAFKVWFAQGTTADGTPIPGILASCSSSDSTIATITCAEGGLVLMQAKRTGRVTFTANATAYGVTQSDSTTFTITPPAFGVVWIKPHVTGLNGATIPAFDPSEITIEPGGTVIWANLTGQPIDIVFDDPTNVLDHGQVSCAAAGAVDAGGVGDVPAFGEVQNPVLRPKAANCRSRRFPVAGVYPYHSTLTPAIGKVTVTDGSSPQ